MSEKQMRKLRKYIIENTQKVLILLRNELGEKTTKLDERGIYQHSKKLFKQGKLKF